MAATLLLFCRRQHDVQAGTLRDAMSCVFVCLFVCLFVRLFVRRLKRYPAGDGSLCQCANVDILFPIINTTVLKSTFINRCLFQFA